MSYSFHLKFCRNKKYVQTLHDEGKGCTGTAHAHTQIRITEFYFEIWTV